MAGLRVGLACGVLLLPGFGVSSSSPQVPGHPTSRCDAGVNCYLQKKIRSLKLRTFYLESLILIRTLFISLQTNFGHFAKT